MRVHAWVEYSLVFSVTATPRCLGTCHACHQSTHTFPNSLRRQVSLGLHIHSPVIDSHGMEKCHVSREKREQGIHNVMTILL